MSDRLFDNLITMDELLSGLRNQYSKWTVYRWVQEGLPSQKIRGKLWFPRDEVTEWLKRR